MSALPLQHRLRGLQRNIELLPPTLAHRRGVQSQLDAVALRATERQAFRWWRGFHWIDEQQHDQFMVHRQRRPAFRGDCGDAGRVGQQDQPRTRPQQSPRMLQCDQQAVIVRWFPTPGSPAHEAWQARHP